MLLDLLNYIPKLKQIKYLAGDNPVVEQSTLQGTKNRLSANLGRFFAILKRLENTYVQTLFAPAASARSSSFEAPVLSTHQ